MIAPEEVKSILETGLPGAEIYVSDMTGGGDHFQITVISPRFSGKTMLEQHQMVQAPLKEAMEDGRIHAIMIKTYSVDQWQKEKQKEKKGSSSSGLNLASDPTR